MPTLRRKNKIERWISALLLLPPALVGSQTVYRCGESYSDLAACPHPQRVPDASDLPATLHSAPSQTGQEQIQPLRLAQTLEKERLAREQRVRRQSASPPRSPSSASVSSSTEPQVITPKRRHRDALPSPYFTARSPAKKASSSP